MRTVVAFALRSPVEERLMHETTESVRRGSARYRAFALHRRIHRPDQKVMLAAADSQSSFQELTLRTSHTSYLIASNM